MFSISVQAVFRLGNPESETESQTDLVKSLMGTRLITCIDIKHYPLTFLPLPVAPTPIALSSSSSSSSSYLSLSLSFSLSPPPPSSLPLNKILLIEQNLLEQDTFYISVHKENIRLKAKQGKWTLRIKL